MQIKSAFHYPVGTQTRKDVNEVSGWVFEAEW